MRPSFALPHPSQRNRVGKQCAGKRLRIAGTMHFCGIDELAHLLVVLRGELDVQGGHVLIKVLDSGRAGDGDDIITLAHQKCQAKLARRAAFVFGQRLDALDQLQILGEVLLAVPRSEAAEIAFLEIGAALDAAGQEPTTQRRIGDGRNSELTTCS